MPLSCTPDRMTQAQNPATAGLSNYKLATFAS
jgi:hypothetical protein